jgi:XTP/dITP diphosphohydrolase
MKLVFATNNQHKLSEISAIIGKDYKIFNLKDISCFEEIPETRDTLAGNALEKAEFVYNKYHFNCFADDTGLEIDSLAGRPGVYSARYAGEPVNFENNMNKVLKEMENIENRNARFITVIALIIDGEKYFFEGVVDGKILREKRGNKGFGYDPIFMPEGYDRSFAQLTAEEKNAISHRGVATAKLIGFLKSLDQQV